MTGEPQPLHAEDPSGADAAPDALERERDDYKDKALRAQADLANLRRRFDEERLSLTRNAANGLAARLLPIVDDLRRAVDSVPAEAAGWGDGVGLVLQNLEAAIRSAGVTPYEPAPGDAFDPRDQEAIAYQPSREQPDGAVLLCARPGYRTEDRVLRPAQVVVARAPEEGGGDAENDS
ncbi:MAG: nucleotide exchange factor GrpE [Chloroflexota bacterium]|nr:nucleotide exchange factor GrpE [Chloroflexota bacterium]